MKFLKAKNTKTKESFNGYMYKAREIEIPDQNVGKVDIKIDNKAVGLPRQQQANLGRFCNEKRFRYKNCHNFTTEVTEHKSLDPIKKEYLFEKTDVSKVDRNTLKKGDSILFGKNLGHCVELIHSGIYIGGGFVLQKLGTASIYILKFNVTMLTYGCNYIFKIKRKGK